MYLKSIEVNGFKSFANKIVFDFNDGITAIVGPNGSGKSNVGDAVRWVLGEQSAKQLRGSKMEDVIFSGTEIRKAQSSAYVAITLDNSDHVLPIDYNEVKVARRVFRSGESEYLINGTSCRLRDVQELFFDTGIGKEGYSIIGQGQIEKILSGKPEERRELFDEAAGIVKFKKRKKTAEKNLEEERLNLSRINDILNEIEHQLEPIEKQSKVAKEYLTLRDSLKSFEVNMFLMEYERIHESSKEVEGKLDIAQENYNSTTAEYDNTKDEYDKLENELEIKNSNIDELKNSLSDNKVSYEKLEGNIKVLNEQLSSFDINTKHYKERIKSIGVEKNEKELELDKCKVDFEENETTIEKLNIEKENINNKLDGFSNNSNEHSSQIEHLQNEIYRIMDEDSDSKSQVERLETLLEQNNIKRVQINQKLLEQKTKDGELQLEINKCEDVLNQINDEIGLNKNNSDNYKVKIESVQKKINELNSSLNINTQQSIKESSKLESLKNMTERYEGYGISIKKVMEKKTSESGILGVVADIIKTESKFETAIEIALGGSIQNIVTDNENTAKKLIEYLKVNKYGRATFLPLTTVKPKGSFNNSDALKEKGVVGLAHTLIHTEDKFKGLIESLVGKVLVVDNIDNAIRIAKAYNNSIRIVTLEGELLNPGGSMSGGAYKNSSNLLGRRREIEDIENTIQKLTKDIENQKNEISQLNEKKSEYVKLSEHAKSNLQELFIKQNTAKMNLEQAQKNYDDMKSFYDGITNENATILSDEKSLKDKIGKLEEKRLESANLKTDYENQITKLNKEISDMRDNEREFNQKIADISSELSGYEQKRQFIMENSRRLGVEIQRLSSEMDSLNSNLDNADSLKQSKTEEICTINKQIEETKVIISDLSTTLDEAIKERDVITKQHKSFFAKREELSSQITSLDKEIFRLTNQKEKLNEQLENFVNYMWEEYEMTYGNALNFRDESIGNYSQIKKCISEIKVKIKNLGDVNVNAIEDFKNLTERHDLLKTQHDDLVESEKVLIGIIEELDIEMRKQFEEKFAFIKKQFDIVFKELFGGGRGNLELIEDEDILDAGIRIIAQPPGKKLQNMMQMSGGEKSLTAIALLFAIQNLKPSPFCLLDEIEAALDDANVKRYAEYLKKLTEHTQFIVITHRRGTMGAADILYGITMQEKGVSTLVSVNLIENQLDK